MTTTCTCPAHTRESELLAEIERLRAAERLAAAQAVELARERDAAEKQCALWQRNANEIEQHYLRELTAARRVVEAARVILGNERFRKRFELTARTLSVDLQAYDAAVRGEPAEPAKEAAAHPDPDVAAEVLRDAMQGTMANYRAGIDACPLCDLGQQRIPSAVRPGWFVHNVEAWRVACPKKEAAAEACPDCAGSGLLVPHKPYVGPCSTCSGSGRRS